MLAITKGYLEGVLKWIQDIKRYKRERSKYNKDLRKYNRFVSYRMEEDRIEKPIEPKKKVISGVALRNTKRFIQYGLNNKMVSKDCIELANQIMEEEF